jgi:DNA helicase-2/ATP-dependent DNA helicase PcrA
MVSAGEVMTGTLAETSIDAEALLLPLNDAQRSAARAVSGPVVIHAGAGTGKTTVLTRRAAYAIATGAVRPERVLLVTFTEKAAGELVGRIASLGLPRVAARTFHSAALAQLRHFWPPRNEGRPLPDILDSPFRIIGPIARRLPGRYRYTPAKDLVDEIGWARSRGLRPETYANAPERADREPPLPVELFLGVFRDYERQKLRAGVIDFDDMLLLTADLLAEDDAARELVRGRYAWFCVDEYQDTSPVQQRLLDLWVGDRQDVCVVGDEDQTIYTFSGATSRYLTDFAGRYPDATIVHLTENHRSSPEILTLANRLIAAAGRTKGLVATRPPGPSPTITAHGSEEVELAAIVAAMRRAHVGGTPWSEMAVLVRLNAQLPPVEDALRAAEVPFRVRGQRFFERPEIREAVGLLRRRPPDATGEALRDALQTLLERRLGYGEDTTGAGAEARERQAALASLLSMVERLVVTDPRTDATTVLADLDRRREAEATRGADGVELATLHRAKGLEWDVVFLPGLEEGSLPVAQAGGDPDAVAEERRLLYVGITRARRELALSWVTHRTSAQGRTTARKPSRFLADLQPRPTGPARPVPGRLGLGSSGGERTSADAAPKRSSGEGGPLFEALRDWRLGRARTDAVPPYVIAHDRTLLEVESRQPRTESELRRIPGLGPKKVEAYGAEILAVVAAALRPG